MTSPCATSPASRASTPPRRTSRIRTTATSSTRRCRTSRTSFSAGRTTSSSACQISREKMVYDRTRNGDILLELRDGRAFQAALAEHAHPFRSPPQHLGRVRPGSVACPVHGQCRPAHGRRRGLAAGAVEPGRHVGRRPASSKKYAASTDFPFNIALRLGACRTTSSAMAVPHIKAYYGRFYNQFGSEIPEAVQPERRDDAPGIVGDTNDNLRLDPGELGAFSGFAARRLPPHGSRRESSVQQPDQRRREPHAACPNLAVSVSYHHPSASRRARLSSIWRPPTSAYTPAPASRTSIRRSAAASRLPFQSQSRAGDACAIASSPTSIVLRERLQRGASFEVQKRTAEPLAAARRSDASASTRASSSGDVHQPDHDRQLRHLRGRLLRPQRVSSTGTIARSSSTCRGSSGCPGPTCCPGTSNFSGKSTGAQAATRSPDAVVTGLSQGTETVFVQQRGEDRTDTREQVRRLSASASGSRSAVASGSRPTVDIFNLLNANHVLLQNEAISTTWSRPTRILAPRIFRLGITARF